MPCRRFDRSSGSGSHRRVLKTFQTIVVVTKYLPVGILNDDKDTATFRNVSNYRVGIKSFPDYKYLLQENYVEYTLFFKNVMQL
jgi:hypothetical protein